MRTTRQLSITLPNDMADMIRPGLRITHYRKRAVITFDVDDERVEILGVFYGGQNYEAILRDELGSEG